MIDSIFVTGCLVAKNEYKIIKIEKKLKYLVVFELKLIFPESIINTAYKIELYEIIKGIFKSDTIGYNPWTEPNSSKKYVEIKIIPKLMSLKSGIIFFNRSEKIIDIYTTLSYIIDTQYHMSFSCIKWKKRMFF